MSLLVLEAFGSAVRNADRVQNMTLVVRRLAVLHRGRRRAGWHRGAVRWVRVPLGARLPATGKEHEMMDSRTRKILIALLERLLKLLRDEGRPRLDWD